MLREVFFSSLLVGWSLISAHARTSGHHHLAPKKKISYLSLSLSLWLVATIFFTPTQIFQKKKNKIM